MTKYIGLTLITCLLPLSGALAQEVPPGCADALLVAGAKGSATTQNAYLTGASLGRNLTQQAWKQSGGCENLEFFTRSVEAIGDSLTPPKAPSEDLVCRYAGAFDGISDALDSFASQCGDVCSTQGDAAGAFAARVYCGISIALGRADLGYSYIRSHARLCGWDYEVGCASAFERTASQYRSAWGTSCSIYLQGENADARDRNESRQCSFYRRLAWFDDVAAPAKPDSNGSQGSEGPLELPPFLQD